MLNSRYGWIVLLIFVLFPALIGYQIFSSLQSATDTARTSVQNLALVLEKDLSTDLATIGRIGSTLAAEIDPQSMQQASVGRNKAQMTRWLRSLAPATETIEALRVFDANGDLLYASEQSAPRINIAESSYFQKLKSAPASGEIYSDKIISQVTGHALILRANAIRDAKGAFLGVVVIGVNLSALQEHFVRINVGHTGMVGLRRFDSGALVVRVPILADLNSEPVLDHPGRQAILQGELSGTHARRSTTDGVQRIYAHRVIGKQTPFFVEVGFGESDYLAEWRQDALIWTCACLLFLLILAVVRYRLMLAQRSWIKSEQQAGATVDALSASLVILNEEGTIIAVNRAWREYSQANGGESACIWEGVNYLAVCDAASGGDAESAGEMAAGIGSVLQGARDKFELEYSCATATETLWFSVSVTPFATAGRTRVVVAHEDITERKRKEEELHIHQIELGSQNDELRLAQVELEAERSRYFDLYELAPAGYLTVSEKGMIQHANLAAAVVLGAPRGGLIGQAISRFILREDQDLFYLNRKRILESGGAQAFELRMVKHDGTSSWAQLAASATQDAEGAAAIRIAMSDITERKQNEQNLERLLAEKETLLEDQQATSRQISRLSQALEQTEESIVVTDLAARIEYVNEAYVKHSGYSREELIGRNSRLLQSGKTPAETYVALWAALRRGQSWRGEFYNRRKDGSEYIESALISPVRQVDGKITHYVGAKTDITRRKQNERALEQAKLAAEAANIAKSRFLATMSHELRTPMNAILGMAQVLQMPEISDTERLDYARTILGSGQTLLTLLNDILDLSKVEAGKVELESIALDPAQVVAEAQGLFAQSARAKGLRMESDCSGVRGGYVGDPYRLRQMLSNLVGNATKFTERGSVRIAARELARDAQSAVLEFSVIDTGIGVTKEEQSRLFQPFSQADSSITRSYGGSGLGLSLVAGMARLMGGEAGVESEAAGGSRFWFRIRAGLSAVTDSAPQQQPCAEAGATAGAMPAKFSGRVLVVEDNPANRKVIGILLHKFGLSTASAEDGQQALEAITQGGAADLILMDVHMPRMDGYAATQAIRAWEKSTGQARRPIIALTADAFRETRQRCLDAGMDQVLTKPLAFDRLQEMLARWLPAQAAVVMTAPAAQPKPLDSARVAALVEEILPLLAQNKFDAVGRYRVLQEAVAGTHLAAEIGDTGRLLERLLFEPALERLRSMAARYGWDAGKQG